MQKSWRAVVYAIVAGLLAAGGVTATMEAATANVAGFCDASGAKASCTDTHTMTGPATITVGVTSNPAQDATVAWTQTCSLNGQTSTASLTLTPAKTPISDDIPLVFTDPDSCTVSATVTLSGTGSLSVSMTFTTASASPSPSPGPVIRLVKGYGGKCLDDPRNSSANRTRIQIWNCNGSDRAESWTFSGGELIHNGKCLNDQRAGGSGTKVILYTCNRAANEEWTHRSGGEFVLKARGGRLCLDDPAYSTRNGTQLIVYACKDAANQRWSQP